MKKILVFALFTLLPITASADSGTCGENCTWSFEGGKLTISGTGEMEQYHSKYVGYYTSDAPWISHRNQITSIEIGEGITNVSDYAFFGVQASSVSLPETVTSLGANSFNGNKKMQTIDLPSGLTSIGEGAFRSATGLTDITIPEGVTTLPKQLFHGATNLTNVTIGSNVTTIENDVFRTTNLTSINIPETLKSVGDYAFAFTNLSEGDLSNTVITKIGQYAFAGTAIKELTLPESYTKIGFQAFINMKNLEKVNIPEGVTAMSYGAFSGCSNLTDIVLPQSLQQITTGDFANCTSLTILLIPAGVTHMDGRPLQGATGMMELWCFSEQEAMCRTAIDKSYLDQSILRLYTRDDNGHYYKDGEDYDSLEDLINNKPHDHSIPTNPIFSTSYGRHPYAVGSKTLPSAN